jgi:hypothetical protein
MSSSVGQKLWIGCRSLLLFCHLIKCWKYVVCKLNLCDGRGPGHGHPDAKASDSLLAERSVKATILAVLLLKEEWIARRQN